MHTATSARRRVLTALGALALGASALVAAAGPTAAAEPAPVCYRGPDPDTYWKITNVATGKVLDVNARSTAPGAPLVQYRWTGGANQQWRAVCAVGGGYQLIARHSGLVADVSGASTADGAKIIQWSYKGSANQRWYFGQVGGTDAGLSTYEIENVGSRKVLDIAPDGLGIVQSPAQGFGGDPTQQWTFESVGSVS
ncbi:ricin-type beta-trefoil lectin protein [Kineococcus xinjiangensis]|uniref:Ricin-type beta-trefoil lectin protein n=1 Tax=Kineococcus xinjiangensis TaxID=512762 RepID=A0A2S6IWH4_9ACTN|nr:RICIN domain-containing protein [Kineococcus xinjiangensis]PPK98683.1 ricin-type beta-trefoil lectin protein [Kineococcus xinjiangensis]